MTPAERGKLYRQRNPNSLRNWIAKNPERWAAIMHRRRCRLHGITTDEYKILWNRQRGRCGICRSKLIESCVDHNHLTKKVRGLLCHHCNKAIGFLKDCPKIAIKAAEYLCRNK